MVLPNFKENKVSDELKKLGWATDDINLFNNTFKRTKTLENAKSWKLLKEAGSKYVFKDKKLFEKFTKLNPEIQQYIILFKYNNQEIPFNIDKSRRI